MTTAAPHRVLIADDSGFMRRVIGASLRAQGFDVVGEAKDGDEALALWEREKPDVMTLDLAMPGRDGMAVLRTLKSDGAFLPVVVVSAFSPAHGARAVDALAEGAFDLVEKPAIGEGLAPFQQSLGEKVRAAAGSRTRRPRTIVPRTRGDHGPATTPKPPASPAVRRSPAGTPRLVVIASSTGGPRALGELIPQLPSPLGAGGLIVQHMPQGFTKSLADRLDKHSPLTVLEAEGGEALAPGQILLAPGGKHLRLGNDRRVRLSDEPPIGALRPRADLTIVDAAEHWRDRLLLVVLTGMGRDGADGAAVVKRYGGRVIVEAEETCTVYGMPRAVVEDGLADRIVPLDQLPAVIAEESRC